MIYYVIKTVTNWKDKQGKEHSIENYYQRTTNVVFPMNHMTNLAGAKKFDCRSEAKRTALKLFRKFEIVRIVEDKTETN